MHYDELEVRNHLIKRLVDAESAIMEVKRFVDIPENKETEKNYPNILTRMEVACSEIDEIRRLLY